MTSDNRTTEQTATERLRKLLDERGVNHGDSPRTTEWRGNGFAWVAKECIGILNVYMFDDEVMMTPEQAIAATLDGAKLTAEQVRAAIERHFGKVAVLDDGKPVEWRDDWVCKVAIDYRGIADELNATLGGGECEIETAESWLPAGRYHRCKNCGAFFAVMNASGDIPPCVCPNCGKAVKR